MENEGRAWDRFMRKLDRRSPGTRKIYLDSINTFFERIEMDAQELYEFRRKGRTSDDPLDRDEVEQMVSDFVHHLSEERGLAPGTVWNHIKPLALFFKAVKMPLDMEEIDAPRKIYNGQRNISAEQIKGCLDAAGTEFKERNRALIMLAKDSGLRVSDLGLMDVGHYLDAVPGHVGEAFKVFRPFKTKKTGDFAHIRIGPEAVDALEAWLDVRGRDPGPLFTKRGGGRVGRKGLSALFLRRRDHLKDGYKISAHSFRKFHTTQCEAGGIRDKWIRRIQGKALPSSYSAPTEEQLTEAYVKAYPKLRVLTQPVDEETRREVDELKVQVEQLSDHVSSLQEMVGAARGRSNMYKSIMRYRDRKEAEDQG